MNKMHKNTVRTAVSLAALLMAAPVALAQGADHGARGGPGADQGGKGAVMDHKDATGAGQRSDVPGADARHGNGAQESGRGRDAGEHGNRDKAAERNNGAERSSQNAAERGQSEHTDKSAERGQNDHTGKSAARDQDGRNDKDKDKNKEARDQDGSKEKSDRTQADRNRDDHRGDKAATGGTPKSGEAGTSGEPSRAEGKGERAGGDQARKDQEVEKKVTSDERDRARDAFGKTGDLKRARNVNVRVNVGAGLPRDVELYDLPPDIVSIVPVYRGYRYVVVEDDICIVDPDTYVVVDVIHRGGGRHASHGAVRLELTEHEQRFIRDHIDRDRRADVHITIGEDLPGSVELYAFPEPVLNEVPKVREYRYVVGEDGVGIVDPKNKDVVYVIQKS